MNTACPPFLIAARSYYPRSSKGVSRRFLYLPPVLQECRLSRQHCSLSLCLVCSLLILPALPTLTGDLQHLSGMQKAKCRG